jgi:hypothetical protein
MPGWVFKAHTGLDIDTPASHAEMLGFTSMKHRSQPAAHTNGSNRGRGWQICELMASWNLGEVFFSVKYGDRPSMVVYACNSSIQEAEAGRLKVSGQLGLHSEILKKKVTMH